jgi:hypothetical protein
MINIRFLYLNFFMILGACALPKQPELTDREVVYFEYLKNQCKCEVKREVNIYVTKDYRKHPNDEGYYHIVLSNMPCETVLDKDSLARVAKSIAFELNNEVIDSNFLYLYERITVNFTCYPTINSPKTLYFNFKSKELK